MDRRERAPHLEELLNVVLEDKQATIWTALPCVVESFDATKQTVSAQATVQARLQDEKGDFQWVTLPLLVDVPVVFPSGGGFTLTFPLKKGDECLVVFSSRCIDAWWQSGGVQPQADLRMHDLSDGFAFPGPRSQPRKLTPAVSTSAVELRSDTGAHYVRIEDSGNVTVAGPTITLQGNVSVTGNLDVGGSSMRHQSINVGRTHTHPAPGGTTGVPNP